SEILALAEKLYKKAVTRRIRVRSVRLTLEDLRPLGYEPDLFEPVFPAGAKKRNLQEAVDSLQIRYGMGAVTRGIVLAASCANGGRHRTALAVI
ncbi:MAG: hypothetical protein FWD78_07060, partial [Treponema sp.]|nr:hypothetical protein [Treponema sp.]